MWDVNLNEHFNDFLDAIFIIFNNKDYDGKLKDVINEMFEIESFKLDNLPSKQKCYSCTLR